MQCIFDFLYMLFDIFCILSYIIYLVRGYIVLELNSILHQYIIQYTYIILLNRFILRIHLSKHIFLFFSLAYIYIPRDNSGNN